MAPCVKECDSAAATSSAATAAAAAAAAAAVAAASSLSLPSSSKSSNGAPPAAAAAAAAEAPPLTPTPTPELVLAPEGACNLVVAVTPLIVTGSFAVAATTARGYSIAASAIPGSGASPPSPPLPLGECLIVASRISYEQQCTNVYWYVRMCVRVYVYMVRMFIYVVCMYAMYVGE